MAAALVPSTSNPRPCHSRSVRKAANRRASSRSRNRQYSLSFGTVLRNVHHDFTPERTVGHGGERGPQVLVHITRRASPQAERRSPLCAVPEGRAS